MTLQTYPQYHMFENEDLQKDVTHTSSIHHVKIALCLTQEIHCHDLKAVDIHADEMMKL